MRPANPLRGEIEILIGGKAFLVRPSFQALVAAEGEVGSLFALVERASCGELTLAEMTALIWHCITNEDRPDRETVGTAILAMGMVKATVPVRAVLGQVLQGET